MKFEGTVQIAAARDKAWAFLMDPNQVGGCGPGVESIDVIDETHFKAKAKVGVGFIKAHFSINMEMTDLDAPNHATVKAHGQAPGSAVDATAQMDLRDGDAAGDHDHGLVGRREHLGHAGQRRRPDDRGHRPQDDRPDLRVHQGQARGLSRRSSGAPGEPGVLPGTR